MQILVFLILLVLLLAFFPVAFWLFGTILHAIWQDFTSIEFWVIFAVFCYALTLFAPKKKNNET